MACEPRYLSGERPRHCSRAPEQYDDRHGPAELVRHWSVSIIGWDAVGQFRLVHQRPRVKTAFQ